MQALKGIFTTSFQELIDSFELATEESIRIQVDHLKSCGDAEAIAEQRRKQALASHQSQRSERTARWKTPGLPLLAEPPILDWEWFFRERVVSDIRYQHLFPHDPEKRARVKDIGDERCVLHGYMSWDSIMREDIDTVGKRKDFYAGLAEDLKEDWLELEKESNDLFA